MRLDELLGPLKLLSRYRGIRDAVRDRDYEYLSPATFAEDTLRLHLKKLFPLLGVNCVVDVGAQYGQFAMLLRQFGYSGRIVSFEPVRASFELLREHSAGDSSWTTRLLAVGNRNESAAINVSEHSEFSSFLQPNAFGARQFKGLIDVAHVEDVQMVRLDDVWQDVTAGLDHPVVYLKMDTQGWDMEVLAGAAGSLGDVIAVQSEVAVQTIYEEQTTTYGTVLEHLGRLGFELSALVPVSLDDRMRVIEYDYIGVRSGERPRPDASPPSVG